MYRAGATLLLLLSCSPPLAAHLLNMSRVNIDVDPDGSVEVRLQLDLTVELGGAEAYFAASQKPEPLKDPQLAALAAEVTTAVQLMHDGVRVELHAVRLQMPDDSLESFLGGLAWPRADLVLQGSLNQPADAGDLRVTFDPAFVFEEPIALTLRETVSGRTLSRWLIAEQRSPPLILGRAAGKSAVIADEPVESAGAILVRYLRYGFDHILPGGLDHLLFVAGLFLGVRARMPLVALVSLYTVAHSITLAMAAFSLIRVDSAIVEPLIAFSILWVAVENLRAAPRLEVRMMVVFALGLVHGLGFAGALRESGLPDTGVLWALAGFNGGVELGQLVWLAVLLVLPGWWQDRDWYGRRVVRPASIVIGVVAFAWTVERIV